MKSAKWLTMFLAVIFSTLAFTACGDDDEDKPDEPNNDNKVAVAGKWYGTVYYNGEASDYDWVTVELSSDWSYKDYNESGVLIGTGTYTYSGSTITIPSGSYISDNWGRTYTVTLSGNTMVWKNAGMSDYQNAEYRFTKQ